MYQNIKDLLLLVTITDINWNYQDATGCRHISEKTQLSIIAPHQGVRLCTLQAFRVLYLDSEFFVLYPELPELRIQSSSLLDTFIETRVSLVC